MSKSQKAAEVDLDAVVATKSGVSASSDNAESSSSVSSGLGDHIDGGTDVLEVWFAGCHSGRAASRPESDCVLIIPFVDIGGGAVSDSTKLSLSEVTLCWMVREVVLAKAPIEFDQAAIQRANLPGSIFEGIAPSQIALVHLLTTLLHFL